jgi:Zn-dependent peptidase ImmA (M78 family)/DNA-binding XRE family transcriptional regulator
MKSYVNTNMIVLAREARGLNQNELAELIKMSATNLSKIERGDIGISHETLESIAETTSFPTQFFTQPGEIITESLSFRKRQVVAQKLIAPVNAYANITKKHIEFLKSGLEIEAPKLPTSPVTDQQTPADIAIKVRKLWNLPSGPINNLTDILEQQSIALIKLDFGTERIDSRSICANDKHPIICLNNALLGDRLRYTLAYELAQLIMHRCEDLPLDREISHEANAFASEFLMPRTDILKDFPHSISIPLLAELKKKWKVSMIALLYRADDLGLLTPNQKRYLLQQFNQLQIRRREPLELDIPVEQPTLVKRWIAEYRAKTGLGMVDMAALLCLNVDEFMELYV